jgi:hypothetical protein
MSFFPSDFRIFFSFLDIYTSSLYSPDIQVMMDYSLFQLFHPLLYDCTDITNFVHMVIEYQNQDRQYFERELDLKDTAYGLIGWAHNLNRFSSVFAFLSRNRQSLRMSKLYYNNTPWLMRNSHQHFLENIGVCINLILKI